MLALTYYPWLRRESAAVTAVEITGIISAAKRRDTI